MDTDGQLFAIELRCMDVKYIIVQRIRKQAYACKQIVIVYSQAFLGTDRETIGGNAQGIIGVNAEAVAIVPRLQTDKCPGKVVIEIKDVILQSVNGDL